MIFSSEKPLFLREYSTRHYSVFPYVVSHLATEILQSFAAVFVQALISFWMIKFEQSFLQFLAVTFSLSMTATAVSVALGAICSNPKVASSLFTLVIIPQFYFSGVFIATELIPCKSHCSFSSSPFPHFSMVSYSINASLSIASSNLYHFDVICRHSLDPVGAVSL